MILVCPAFRDIRERMFEEIDLIFDAYSASNHATVNEKFKAVMGTYVNGIDFCCMLDVWITGASYIMQMYNARVKTRKGVG